MRTIRFMDKEKQVNEKWAIDLISANPIKFVNTRIVACEGDPNPALGHPKVFINLDTNEPKGCIYCGQMYQFKADA